jgi:hypothetical protein
MSRSSSKLIPCIFVSDVVQQVGFPWLVCVCTCLADLVAHELEGILTEHRELNGTILLMSVEIFERNLTFQQSMSPVARRVALHPRVGHPRPGWRIWRDLLRLVTCGSAANPAPNNRVCKACDDSEQQSSPFCGPPTCAQV